MQENHELILTGSIILDPSIIEQLDGEVSWNEFTDPALSAAYQALCLTVAAGDSIADPALALSALRRHKVALTATEIVRAAECGQPHHAIYHAKQIRRAALIRKHQRIAEELARKAQDPSSDPQDLSDWLKAQLGGIESYTSQRGTVSLYEAAIKAITAIEDTSTSVPPVFTGLLDVDQQLGGFRPGELVVIAARPGIGKTCLGTQIAMFAAGRDRRSLIVSLEMSDTELALRILCGRSGVDSRLVRTGTLDHDDIKTLKSAAESVDGIPCYLWDPPAATVESIRGVALREKCHGLSLLVVDYLQLVKTKGKYGNRNEEVTHISNSLKRLARELQVPVLAMAQLNRTADGEVPKLSTLRESGAIEQDADMVIFIHQEPLNTQLIVAKNRHGATGALPVRWIPHETRFADRLVTSMPNYNKDLEGFNQPQEAF